MKGALQTITSYHKKLLVGVETVGVEIELEINEISKYCLDISQRAYQLRESAQTVPRNAKKQFEALQKVVDQFLTSGIYKEKSLRDTVHALDVDQGLVPKDKIERINAINGLPLLFVLLGMNRRQLQRMRKNPFNALMSLICSITIDKEIPTYAKDLHEFIRTPGKTYLDIGSEIQKYAACRENGSDPAAIDTQCNDIAGSSSLKRKRVEEDIGNSKNETHQPRISLEAAFEIGKEQYLEVLKNHGADGLLGLSSNTEENATILVAIERREAKLLPKSLHLSPSTSATISFTQPGPIFFARTLQSSVS